MMVDRYPTEIKAFYFQPDEQRPELALGVDVIAPEGYGEIIGGGQRIHDLALLETQTGGAQSAARSVRMVSGSATLWNGSPRRFRHGRGAIRSVAVRPGACSRDDSVSAHAVPHTSLRLAECATVFSLFEERGSRKPCSSQRLPLLGHRLISERGGAVSIWAHPRFAWPD